MNTNDMNATTAVPQNKRRVCVIGAGTAGLCAIHRCIEQGFDVVAYEMDSEIGGTWLYSEKIPDDPYKNVHSSLYENLRTNLPKEIMSFPDFPYPATIQESFISAADVLKYLQSYAKRFQLYSHIKFQHEVIRVRPRKDEWEVYARDLTIYKSSPAYFDFVFVCNGHYSAPKMPEIPGMDIFKGQQMHSHFYRKASVFKDANVLVLGAGPSGIDITQHLCTTATRVFLSHHLNQPLNTDSLKNLTQKPDIERFTESGAIFKDGTTEEFTHVVYCTGYKYSFPCISTDAGFRVINNWVQPLWKHIIVINNPTMALIGLPFQVIPQGMFDLQVRFALTYFTGKKALPSAAEMQEDMNQDMEVRRRKGWSDKLAHKMGELQFDYYDQLANTAEIENIKPVYRKMMKDCSKRYIYEFATFRNICYRVIDDENFIKYPLA